MVIPFLKHTLTLFFRSSNPHLSLISLSKFKVICVQKSPTLPLQVKGLALSSWEGSCVAGLTGLWPQQVSLTPCMGCHNLMFSGDQDTQVWKITTKLAK